MREVTRSALVALPPAELYALIIDIERYPEFVPGCSVARIESRGEREVVATIGIRRGGLDTEFTTRNTLDPDRSVAMRLERGPFKALEGLWSLRPVGESGCEVTLRLRFEFANRFTAMMFSPMFEQTAASLVDAFVVRAREVAARRSDDGNAVYSWAHGSSKPDGADADGEGGGGGVGGGGGDGGGGGGGGD